MVLVRASDVPTYVQYGGADLGVAGRDVLHEQALASDGAPGLYQPLDLKIARCRMSVATRVDFDYAAAIKQGLAHPWATKYTETARQHFADKGVHVDLIKLYGSMELAPLTGLADAIVDLVSTGGTLKANKLVEVESFMEISSRLVVNQAALAQARQAARLDRRLCLGRSRMIKLRQLDTASASFEADFERLRHWSEDTDAAIEGRVAEILADVRTRGDAALLDYTARFDRLQATSVAELQISAGELKAAFDGLPPAQAQALQAAAARVRRYHERQLEACGRSWTYRDDDGSLLGQKVTRSTASASTCPVARPPTPAAC